MPSGGAEERDLEGTGCGGGDTADVGLVSIEAGARASDADVAVAAVAVDGGSRVTDTDLQVEPAAGGRDAVVAVAAVTHTTRQIELSAQVPKAEGSGAAKTPMDAMQ